MVVERGFEKVALKVMIIQEIKKSNIYIGWLSIEKKHPQKKLLFHQGEKGKVHFFCQTYFKLKH